MRAFEKFLFTVLVDTGRYLQRLESSAPSLASIEPCFSQELAGPSFNCSCMIVTQAKVGSGVGAQKKRNESKKKKKSPMPSKEHGAGKERVPNFSREGVEMHCTGGD